MANKIIQAVALPTGEQGQIIYIDNGDGTYTQTVAFDRDTYPSRAADITPGAGIIVAGGGSGFGMLGLPSLPSSAEYLQVYQALLGNGDTDLYTVPAGKRVIVALTTFYNTTATPRNGRTQVKISGTYYAISQSTSLGANAAAPVGTLLNTILEAGDILAVNVDTGAAINVEFRLIQFNNTFGLRTARLLTVANGNNTVYTVPVGKHTIALNNSPFVSPANDTVIGFVNRSGGPRSVQGFFTPNGGTPIQFSNTAALADGSISFVTRCGPSLLNPGDAVVVATNSAAAEQTAWFNLYEY